MVILFIIAFNIGVKKERSLSLCMQHCHERQCITLSRVVYEWLTDLMHAVILLPDATPYDISKSYEFSASYSTRYE